MDVEVKKTDQTYVKDHEIKTLIARSQKGDQSPEMKL